MAEVSENTIMPFGIYKGEKLANVPADYLLYLLRSGKCYGTIKQYIQENKSDLEIEVKQLQKGKND